MINIYNNNFLSNFAELIIQTFQLSQLVKYEEL